jgi:hypothetical protein
MINILEQAESLYDRYSTTTGAIEGLISFAILGVIQKYIDLSTP